MKASSVLAAGASLAAPLDIARSAHAGGRDTIRVGLVGCGGRGTGAARDAVQGSENVIVTAMGDMFQDRLTSSLNTLRGEIGEKCQVQPETCFVGFDAYKQVIDSGVDLVLLCTPPHFRPLHIEAAVAAGKHIFCEKPVAVDGPGVRRVLAACEEARKKKLAVVNGLCWRYHNGVRETMARIHDGAVGRIVTMQTTYNVGYLWVKPRQPEWSDMEWQLRNWLYFTWLSGDHNVEQHVHSLDKMAWAMKDEYPISASGMGGRQVRTGPEYGHIFDHHAVVYEFAGGVRLFSFCRQISGCENDVSDHIFGTKGHCDVLKHAIDGETNWRFRGKPNNMYENEHRELVASIRAGEPLHNGDYMCKSTMMAIMGRMTTYTGQKITWEQALQSKEDLTPPKYELGPLPVPPVAKPGITKFV
jgi:predicted dehydrogenase